MSETDPKPENDNEDSEAVEAEAEAQAEADAAEDAALDAEASQDESAEEAPPTPEQRIVELEAALAHAHKERLLALAEAENAGKRADKRISDNAKYATSNISKALLDVADNLERALLAAPEDLRKDSDVVKNLAVGVEMTGKALTTVLEGQGVSKFVSLDQPFDPNRHQAMQEVENPDVPTGTIVQVVQEGYMMSDRLLRPAMVVISKGGPKREAPAPDSGEQKSGVDTEV